MEEEMNFVVQLWKKNIVMGWFRRFGEHWQDSEAEDAREELQRAIDAKQRDKRRLEEEKKQQEEGKKRQEEKSTTGGRKIDWWNKETTGGRDSTTGERARRETAKTAQSENKMWGRCFKWPKQ